MANLYVRNTIREWLSSSVIPFYDTVNLEQNPQDPMWCTVDWGFSFADRTTFCNTIEEDGSFQIVYFGKPGIGDEELLEAAEKDMELLMEQIDPNYRLTLDTFSAAEDFLEENFYGVSFLVSYRYQRS